MQTHEMHHCQNGFVVWTFLLLEWVKLYFISFYYIVVVKNEIGKEQ